MAVGTGGQHSEAMCVMVLVQIGYEGRPRSSAAMPATKAKARAKEAGGSILRVFRLRNADGGKVHFDHRDRVFLCRSDVARHIQLARIAPIQAIGDIPYRAETLRVMMGELPSCTSACSFVLPMLLRLTSLDTFERYTCARMRSIVSHSRTKRG